MNQTVWKYESGDKKSIFGRPYTYNGTKWIPDEGGSSENTSEKKPEKVSKEPVKRLSDNTNDPEYNKFSNKITAHLSPKHQEALMRYADPEASGGGGGAVYLSVNGHLRNREELSSEDKKIFAQMKEAFDQAPPLHKDVTAYRGAWLDPDTIAKLKPGGTFQDKAFVSTSMNPKTAKAFSSDEMSPGGDEQPCHFTMKIPKGTKAIPISDIPNVMYPNEKELLLDKSAKFKISKVEFKDGVHHIEMEKI